MVLDAEIQMPKRFSPNSFPKLLLKRTRHDSKTLLSLAANATFIEIANNFSFPNFPF